jgi:hypothetical protein
MTSLGTASVAALVAELQKRITAEEETAARQVRPTRDVPGADAARRDAALLVALITDALLDGNIHGQHPDQTGRLTRAKALARAALQRLIGGDV